jgi:xanthine dehydrogenase accessory factor
MTDTQARTDPWSVTRAELFDSLREYRDRDADAVVATVVDVEGSAYRRPGAKMVIDPGTESLGAITAGCLEGPVTDLASEVLAEGSPRVHTFDLMDDEEWGLGLGCNGIIDILLEPLDGSWDRPLADLERGRELATVTAVESTDADVTVGDRAYVATEGQRHDPVDRRSLPETVLDAATDRVAGLRAERESATVTVDTDDGTVTLFVDWLAPAPELLLFGNQNDVHPVARVGREAGFRVVVASARGGRSDPDQFPDAHEVRATRPMEIDEVVDLPERTYAVVMSHNMLEDRMAVAALLDTPVPYVGLMGPRERFEELRDALAAEEDRELTAEELDRIATPVGLDVGGGEPIQIAISIVAEALAVHNGRDGGRLKEREGPIHARPQVSD